MNPIPKLDEVITVNLPKGDILTGGKDVVTTWVRENNLPSLPDDWKWVWTVTGKEEYVGTFTKRLSNFLYKEHTVKITPKNLSALGTAISRHVSKESVYYIDFTKNFNWSAGQFGDTNSCYWGKNSLARDLFKEAGGMAMRFWSSPIENIEELKSKYRIMRGKNRAGLGRAWLIRQGDIYALFNVYISDQLQSMRLNGLEARVEYWDFPRTLAHLLGVSYQKTNVYNGDDGCGGVIYINSDGFAVGLPQVLAALEGIDLDIDTSNVTGCNKCETYVWKEVIAGDGLCQSCWDADSYECDHCQETFHGDDSSVFDNYIFCPNCYEDQIWDCRDCGDEYYAKDTPPTLILRRRMKYCRDCVCTRCDRAPNEGNDLCSECYEEENLQSAE